MPFQVSPGVNISEIDLSTVVPAVATTEGAIVGVFSQGPVNERVLIDSENTLKTVFGKPSSDNYETWFTASNFLAYGNKLYVTRVVSANATNATEYGNTSLLIETRTEAEAETGDGTFIAKSIGADGNSLKVSVCYDSTDFEESITIPSIAIGNTTFDLANSSYDTTEIDVGDILRVGNTSLGFQDLTVATIGSEIGGVRATTFTPAYRLKEAGPTTATRHWRYYNNVESAPASGNVHIVIIDEDGTITGEAETVLEVHRDVSRTDGTLDDQGQNIYYQTVINESSDYIWVTATTLTNGTKDNYISLSGGLDGNDGTESTITLSRLATGFDLYNTTENVDISLFLAGKADTNTANYIIDNICEVRKDCVVFVSPEREDVVNQSTNSELDQITGFRDGLSSSSYAVMDSGYKYQYDKYSDLYRWVPLNGDVAGLCARTDDLRDPWWSPAGYNRGIIKNVVKLAFNPLKSDRDILYKKGINPVISQAGQGTLLFGDKTLLAKPSAFDRINVRRLFIVLEKAISTAAK
ncbi:MAG: phage tail sheath subtilisin-like domain-containing protein, partial [Anaerolineales bacterium]|nr:phage tail sheath subtilisin-like domain-containing protein [Anaerolineales bacterium]